MRDDLVADLDRTLMKALGLVRALRLQRAGAEPPPSPTKEFLKWFEAEYARRRHGAKYFVRWAAHGAIVKRLLLLHPPERLKQHAQMLLGTDEEWTEGTDRGIEVLAAKINWLEERLAAWEARRRGPPASP